MYPKVTVIIPYKIDRGWLKEAIQSVPSWVQLLISQGEGDWAENFNKALPQATGDYIKFLHEDDTLTPNCIEDSVKAIEDLGVDYIHGKSWKMNEQSQVTGIFVPPKSITYYSHLKDNKIYGTTLMFRKEVFEKLKGFDESLHHSEEYEFTLRCFQHGFKLGYCDSFLANYRRHKKEKSEFLRKDIVRLCKELVNKHIESYECSISA